MSKSKVQKEEDPLEKLRERAQRVQQTRPNGRRLGASLVAATQPKPKKKER